MALSGTSDSTGQSGESGHPDGAQPHPQGLGAPLHQSQVRRIQLPGPGGPHLPCWHRPCSSSRRPPTASLHAQCLQVGSRHLRCHHHRRRHQPLRHRCRHPYHSRQHFRGRRYWWPTHLSQTLTTWSQPWLPLLSPLSPLRWLPTRPRPHPRLQPPLRPHPQLQQPPPPPPPPPLSLHRRCPSPPRFAHARTKVPEPPGV